MLELGSEKKFGSWIVSTETPGSLRLKLASLFSEPKIELLWGRLERKLDVSCTSTVGNIESDIACVIGEIGGEFGSRSTFSCGTFTYPETVRNTTEYSPLDSISLLGLFL